MSYATSARKGDPRAIISNGQPEIFRKLFEDSAHYTDRESLADKLSRKNPHTISRIIKYSMITLD
jgi:hypothetical protein